MRNDKQSFIWLSIRTMRHVYLFNIIISLNANKQIELSSYFSHAEKQTFNVSVVDLVPVLGFIHTAMHCECARSPLFRYRFPVGKMNNNNKIRREKESQKQRPAATITTINTESHQMRSRQFGISVLMCERTFNERTTRSSHCTTSNLKFHCVRSLKITTQLR